MCMAIHVCRCSDPTSLTGFPTSWAQIASSALPGVEGRRGAQCAISLSDLALQAAELHMCMCGSIASGRSSLCRENVDDENSHLLLT